MTLVRTQNRPSWPEQAIDLDIARVSYDVVAGEYGTELVRERLPLFIDEAAEAFHAYWQPAPPIEEQLAAMRPGQPETKIRLTTPHLVVRLPSHPPHGVLADVVMEARVKRDWRRRGRRGTIAVEMSCSRRQAAAISWRDMRKWPCI